MPQKETALRKGGPVGDLQPGRKAKSLDQYGFRLRHKIQDDGICRAGLTRNGGNGRRGKEGKEHKKTHLTDQARLAPLREQAACQRGQGAVFG